jgi:NAD(P)-dependent dehydrogenase (short-subunit alcohol dehydrogenase family)
MRKKPLSDQVLVVTGASSGLGRAIARGAGARGAKVVVTARNAEALDNCVREIERLGGQALAVPADHAVQDEVAQVVEQALERFGRIDTYVANAIVTVYAEVEQLEPEELRRVMDVNFLGVVYGYWAALPHLRETKGTGSLSPCRRSTSRSRSPRPPCTAPSTRSASCRSAGAPRSCSGARSSRPAPAN